MFDEILSSVSGVTRVVNMSSFIPLLEAQYSQNAGQETTVYEKKSMVSLRPMKFSL